MKTNTLTLTTTKKQIISYVNNFFENLNENKIMCEAHYKQMKDLLEEISLDKYSTIIATSNTYSFEYDKTEEFYKENGTLTEEAEKQLESLRSVIQNIVKNANNNTYGIVFEANEDLDYEYSNLYNEFAISYTFSVNLI